MCLCALCLCKQLLNVQSVRINGFQLRGNNQWVAVGLTNEVVKSVGSRGCKHTYTNTFRFMSPLGVTSQTDTHTQMHTNLHFHNAEFAQNGEIRDLLRVLRRSSSFSDQGVSKLNKTWFTSKMSPISIFITRMSPPSENLRGPAIFSSTPNYRTHLDKANWVKDTHTSASRIHQGVTDGAIWTQLKTRDLRNFPTTSNCKTCPMEWSSEARRAVHSQADVPPWEWYFRILEGWVIHLSGYKNDDSTIAHFFRFFYLRQISSSITDK